MRLTIRTSLVAAVSIALSAASVAAQSAPPRPPNPGPQQFTFPRVKTHTLPNGLRVHIVEDHSAQVVAVRAVVAVDSTFDPAGKEGLYQVTFATLREGTTTRTPAQLAEASARLGTPVSPTAFTTIPSQFEGALALMGDMLMHPSFDASAIGRRKASLQATFRSVNALPATAARALTYALLDGRDDPVARSQYASEASVANITRDDVVSFYDAHVGPSTTALVIVGDVTEAAALATATRIFGKWTKAASAMRSAGNPPAPRPTTIYLYDRPGAAPYMYVGNLGPQRTAPDAFATEMLSVITSRRFMQTLRDERSFIYAGAVTIFWKPAPRASEFFGYTTAAPSKADSVLVEWIGLLRGLRGSAPVSAAELKTAINARIGPLFNRTDGPDAVAARMVEALRDNLPPDFLGRYAEEISKLTPADIAAAAAKHIDVDHLVIVVTGDRKALEPALRAANIAPVVLVDANGRPIGDQ
jgi:zinc protease